MNRIIRTHAGNVSCDFAALAKTARGKPVFWKGEKVGEIVATKESEGGIQATIKLNDKEAPLLSVKIL